MDAIWYAIGLGVMRVLVRGIIVEGNVFRRIEVFYDLLVYKLEARFPAKSLNMI